MAITLSHDEPGENVTRTTWSTGNRLRWSPQNVRVSAAPLCISVTMVMEVPPLVALTCTMLTAPATVLVPEFRAPPTNMSPQEMDDITANTKRTLRRRCTHHLRGKHPGGSKDALSLHRCARLDRRGLAMECLPRGTRALSEQQNKFFLSQNAVCFKMLDHRLQSCCRVDNQWE